MTTSYNARRKNLRITSRAIEAELEHRRLGHKETFQDCSAKDCAKSREAAIRAVARRSAAA